MLDISSFSRKHYSRLRLYWSHGHGKGLAHLDNIDLDLCAVGWIVRQESQWHQIWHKITTSGEQALATFKTQEIVRRQPHHSLAGRLAQWLREKNRITWENIELQVKLESGGSQCIRPDVFSLLATYDEKRINPVVHEVKVSRSDFLADLAKPEKRNGYQRISEHFYYVAPVGMLSQTEIPAECGLLEETTEGVFKVTKRAKKKKVSLTPHHYMNLILKAGTVAEF